MSAQGDTVVVDLQGVRSAAELMDALGDALELGGPNGNVQVQHPTDGRGWGKNWDALLDSLTCLDSGGIWGTSRKLRFPLRLELKNSSTYRATDQKGFGILMEILDTARERYGENDLHFTYGIQHDA